MSVYLTVPVVLCQRRSGTPALETIDGGVVIRPAREGVNCRLINDGKGGRPHYPPPPSSYSIVSSVSRNAAIMNSLAQKGREEGALFVERRKGRPSDGDNPSTFPRLPMCDW